jgi:hypothetical protein
MARALMPNEAEANSSEILLRFAVENKKDLAQAVDSAISTALDAQQANTWDHCTLIKSVTLETLSTNLHAIPPPKWNFWIKTPQQLSLSRRSATRYVSLLISLLVVAVILSFVVSAASKLSAELQTPVDAANQLTGKMVSEIDPLEPGIGNRNFAVAEAKGMTQK